MRILLIEDNPADVRLTQEALRECGAAHQLEVTSDGEQALKLLRKLHARDQLPELILLDLNLPRRNGREVLADIKQNPQLRSIPVIILSTSEADQDIRACYDLHANSFISKPVDINDFVDTMRALDVFWGKVVKLPPQSSRIAPSA